jgi:hypothetical protein
MVSSSSSLEGVLEIGDQAKSRCFYHEGLIVDHAPSPFIGLSPSRVFNESSIVLEQFNLIGLYWQVESKEPASLLRYDLYSIGRLMSAHSLYVVQIHQEI